MCIMGPKLLNACALSHKQYYKNNCFYTDIRLFVKATFQQPKINTYFQRTNVDLTMLCQNGPFLRFNEYKSPIAVDYRKHTICNDILSFAR